MRFSSRCLIVAITIAWWAMAPLGAQSRRDYVRLHGDTTITLTACGGLTGLKPIIDIAPFTVEGTITAAESKLPPEEDDVYTAYDIDVIRAFRGPATAARSTPGPTGHSSPFVVGAPLTRPGVTKQRVRLHRLYHGRVVLYGGVLTATDPLGPTLSIGQNLPKGTLADRIVIEKAARILSLYHEGQVLKTYKIALGPNAKGHKEREGDGRTPEGKYVIDSRKADSSFHRALHVSYPNQQDRMRARRLGVSPGGAIMIHGLPNGMGSIGKTHLLRDWTQGCIAVTNEEIEEIWRLVPNGTPVEIRP